MSEMLKRVAMALKKADEEGQWPQYPELARIAITAMREPTEAMLMAPTDAGCRDYDSPSPEDDWRRVWQAMIAVALGNADVPD